MPLRGGGHKGCFRPPLMIDLPTLRQLSFPIQWNPSKTDTIGTNDFVCHIEVSLAQGVVIDHARPTITATYDKAWLWTMKRLY